MPARHTTEEREARDGNLVAQLSRKSRLRPYLFAAASGVLASCAFAPLNLSVIAWVALVPLLYAGCRRNAPAFRLGYVFAVVHFTTTFAWLVPVFILAPLLIALVLALLPACWLKLTQQAWLNLRTPQKDDLLPRNGPQQVEDAPLAVPRQCLLLILAAAAWCTVEWIRGWIFTGFPWNQLGVSQWQNSLLLPASAYVGVAGISFVIATVNLGIWLLIQQRRGEAAGAVPVPLLIASGLFVLAAAAPKYHVPPASTTVRVATVQGNIPQIRSFNKEQLEHAVDVYFRLTYRVVEQRPPDLVIWPETAIPASLTAHENLAKAMTDLCTRIDRPLLVGSIDMVHAPGDPIDVRSSNAALVYDHTGQVTERYYKMHLVPFGEYVPFARYLPILVKWIGMGRGLTPGREYTILQPVDGMKLGMNICYEDVFPDISRGFVLRGANVLGCITNDAWFEESSGSHQHLAHSVFRAVENARPMIRSGNNADSALILPDGTVTDLLVDKESGSRFARAVGVYKVPIHDDLPVTFYTRHGNWLEKCLALVTAALLYWCIWRGLDRRRRLLAKVARVE
jgi:apolipoprotein N-acyltransferase